jgi:hypothetical protein
VELDEIDIILQLRTNAGDWTFIDLPGSAAELEAPTHPLAKATLRLAREGAAKGASLIAVQALRRMTGPGDGEAHVRDRFGVADLVSQPTLDHGDHVAPRVAVKAGEPLLGHANGRGDPPGVADPFLRDGTFMVIRQIGPHPVHACPAYEMAMGTMLGVLTALLRAGEIQALPQPFLVRLVAPGLP